MRTILSLLLILVAAATANDRPSEAWPVFGRDLQNTNHYPQETGSKYQLLWSTRAGCPAPGMGSTMVTKLGMFNTSPCSNTGDTHAVGLDGKHMWANGVGKGKRGIISSPCIHKGTVYSVDNGLIKAVRAKDGSLIWEQEVTCGKISLSSPIIHEGRLFLSGTTGIQITQIDRTKAAQDTVLEIEDCHGVSAPGFHNGQMIAFGLHKVYSFDARSLKLNWETWIESRSKERLVNSPVIDVANGRIFAATAMTYAPSGRLYGLSLNNGKILWQQETEGTGMTPALTFDGKHLYAASMNGTVTAYAPDKGTPVWKWTMPGESKAKDGKMDHSRLLGGLISSKNKLVFACRKTLFIISSDHPQGIDFEIDLNGFGTPTPAFYQNDLFIRSRSKQDGASNCRYTDAKEKAAASDVKVDLIGTTAHIRNLSESKLSFFQFCYGINVNEKQNCMHFEMELQPGEKEELDLERFLAVDEKIHHLLFALQYETPDGEREFQRYFSMESGNTGE